MGSVGTEFHKDLDISNVDFIAQKGQNKLVESFSAFGNSELLDFIKSKSIGRVFCCGLAYDFCVGSSAVDVAKNGIESFVIRDASRGISKETSEAMENQFTKYGVKVINSDEIF
jgi:nicotinamidase/pyrazinamidase